MHNLLRYPQTVLCFITCISKQCEMVMEQALSVLCTKDAEHTTHSCSNEWPPHSSSHANLPGKQRGMFKHNVHTLECHTMLYLLTPFPISYNLNVQLTNSMVSFFDLLNHGSITCSTWGASIYYKNYTIILQLDIPLIICPHTAHKIAQKMGVALCHEKAGCPCTTTTNNNNNKLLVQKEEEEGKEE